MPYVLSKGLAYGVFFVLHNRRKQPFLSYFRSFSACWYTNHNPENSGILWADPDS